MNGIRENSYLVGMNRIVVALIACMCVVTSFAMSKGANISVLEVGHDSLVSSDKMELFYDVLELRIAETQRVTLLERRNMSEILQEQGFQQSGACNTSECQVQMGQLLGVEYILVGNVKLIEDDWFLNFKVISVETGKIDVVSALQFSGDFKAMIGSGVPKIVNDLFGSDVQHQVVQAGFIGLDYENGSDGSFLVTNVVKYGPAWMAGVRDGSKILSINGNPSSTYRQSIPAVVNEPIVLVVSIGEENKSVTLVPISEEEGRKRRDEEQKATKYMGNRVELRISSGLGLDHDLWGAKAELLLGLGTARVFVSYSFGFYSYNNMFIKSGTEKALLFPNLGVGVGKSFGKYELNLSAGYVKGQYDGSAQPAAFSHVHLFHDFGSPRGFFASYGAGVAIWDGSLFPVPSIFLGYRI